jgi:hypothetical protein
MDLGYGDGRAVIAAASRVGVFTVVFSRNRAAGRALATRRLSGDLFKTDLASDGITLFLLDDINQASPGAPFAEARHASRQHFQDGRWGGYLSGTRRAAATGVLHLWIVPARVECLAYTRGRAGTQAEIPVDHGRLQGGGATPFQAASWTATRSTSPRVVPNTVDVGGTHRTIAGSGASGAGRLADLRAATFGAVAIP